jgi:hypothetical protein
MMMKALITIAFVVGLFSVAPTAGAQNAAPSSLPSNVPQVTGNDEFCLETATEHTLECVYASMDDCQNNTKSSHLLCVPNPH